MYMYIDQVVMLHFCVQALLFDDCLRSDDQATFKHYADDRLSCPPDLNLLTLLFTCAKRALRKHSIRATSAEVHLI